MILLTVSYDTCTCSPLGHFPEREIKISILKKLMPTMKSNDTEANRTTGAHIGGIAFALRTNTVCVSTVKRPRASATAEKCPCMHTRRLAVIAAAVYICAPSACTALGAKNGILWDCFPATTACISSQDDTPLSFMEPWQYEEDALIVFKRIRDVIIEEGGSVIDYAFPYLRARFEVRGPPLYRSEQDEIEFYFTKGDNIIQFRSDGVKHPKFDFFRNRKRLERLRQKTGLDSVTVLRGRQRKFLFFETPFDDFGPSLPGIDDLIENQSDVSPL